jgi:peptide/nickel transport system substrate-binding protein
LVGGWGADSAADKAALNNNAKKASIGPSVAAGSKATSGPFVINSTFPPVTLDPHRIAGVVDPGFIKDLYSTLLQYDQRPITGVKNPAGVRATRENQQKIIPYLAESYKVSPDGRTFTFKLRRNVRFSSGRPVNSAAVLASMERIKKVNAGPAYYLRAGQPDLNMTFSAPDPRTFVVKIARREALVIHMFANTQLSIVDVAEVNAQGGDGANLPAQSNQWIATHSAGAGPYVIKEYRPGSRAVLTANPTYFGPKPKEKTVVVNFITSDQTLLLQARNRAAHVTLGMSKKSVRSLDSASSACCNVVKIPVHTTQFIALPNKWPPFNNRLLREALTHAVPYQDILKQVASGYGTLYYGILAPNMEGFNPKLSKPRAYNLTRARNLIRQSGVQLPITADLLIQDGFQDQPQIATIVQSVWKQLGINLNIRSLPPAIYNSPQGIYFQNKSPLIRWDGAGIVSPLWQLDYDMRCETVTGNTNFTNTTDYCHWKAEDYLNKAHRNAGNNQKYWDEITKMWIRVSPRIPVYAETYTVVLDKSVKNWTYNQFGPFNVARWSR